MKLDIPASTQTKPEWLRVPQACQLFGLSRSKLYELITDGRIRSVSLRDRGQVRGCRLISYDSLATYLDELANEQDAKA